jgi:ribosomal protein S18 acetylase RimI-like enzyme
MLPADKSAYCEFLDLQGHRVVQTRGSVWIDVRRRVFQPAPPFHLQPEQAYEARRALRQSCGLACRWFTPAQMGRSPNQANSTASVYVLRPPYDLSRIQSKARNQTRRGLERVKVCSVNFDPSVESQAFPVYADNVDRLGLFKTSEQMKRRWAQWVSTLSRSRCAEFWGAWEGDRLVAFSVLAFSPWGSEIVCQRSLASHLDHYPNNALVFSIAMSIFQRGAAVLSFGLAEFGSREEGLDHFKRGITFQGVPLQEHLCWHPALRFLDPIFALDRFRVLARLLKRWTRVSRNHARGKEKMDLITVSDSAPTLTRSSTFPAQKTEVVVRPIKSADLTAVAALQQAAFPEDFLSRLGRNAIEQYYAWHIQKAPDGAYLGAWCEGTFAGFCFGGTIQPGLRRFYPEHAFQIAGWCASQPQIMFTPVTWRALIGEAASLGFHTRRRIFNSSEIKLLNHCSSSFYIMRIAVASVYRRRGVARCLMLGAEAEASARGILNMHLWVDTNNSAAINLYRALGWELLFEKHQRYRMAKRLERDPSL